MEGDSRAEGRESSTAPYTLTTWCDKDAGAYSGSSALWPEPSYQYFSQEGGLLHKEFQWKSMGMGTEETRSLFSQWENSYLPLRRQRALGHPLERASIYSAFLLKKQWD